MDVKLTTQGTETMLAIGRIAYGRRQLGFFDNGVTAGSGSWGECLTGELGHKSSGVINQLVKLGLFDTSKDYNGTWFELTELGVKVALELAGAEAAEINAALVAQEAQVDADHAEALELNDGPVGQAATGRARARRIEARREATYRTENTRRDRMAQDRMDAAHAEALERNVELGMVLLVKTNQHPVTNTQIVARLVYLTDHPRATLDEVRQAIGIPGY